MEKHEKTVFIEAMKTWGAEAQVMQLWEEMSELAIEIHKVRRKRPTTREDIAGEIADVGIMIDQMIVILLGDSGEELVQDIRRKKVRRLNERIEAEKKKREDAQKELSKKITRVL